MYSCLVVLAGRTGVVKILTFFELEPRLNSKYGFHRADKNGHFSKASVGFKRFIYNGIL